MVTGLFKRKKLNFRSRTIMIFQSTFMLFIGAITALNSFVSNTFSCRDADILPVVDILMIQDIRKPKAYNNFKSFQKGTIQCKIHITNYNKQIDVRKFQALSLLTKQHTATKAPISSISDCNISVTINTWAGDGNK